jgi:hypothetical protein
VFGVWLCLVRFGIVLCFVFCVFKKAYSLKWLKLEPTEAADTTKPTASVAVAAPAALAQFEDFLPQTLQFILVLSAPPSESIRKSFIFSIKCA